MPTRVCNAVWVFSLLSVVLMRLRIAEIHKDAVSHVFRDEPAEATHGLRDAVLIGRNDFAEVFRVHTSRERRRTNKVREHHGDLAALGAIIRLRGIGCRSRWSKLWRAFLDSIQFGDRAQQ